MVVGNVFGMLISIAPPAPDDEMGPGIDFSLAVNLLAPAFSAIGEQRPIGTSGQIPVFPIKGA